MRVTTIFASVAVLTGLASAGLEETAFAPDVVIGVWEKPDFQGQRYFFPAAAFNVMGDKSCVNLDMKSAKAFNITSYARTPDVAASREFDSWTCYLYKHPNCVPCPHDLTVKEQVIVAPPKTNANKMEHWSGLITSLKCCNPNGPGGCPINNTVPAIPPVATGAPLPVAIPGPAAPPSTLVPAPQPASPPPAPPVPSAIAAPPTVIFPPVAPAPAPASSPCGPKYKVPTGSNCNDIVAKCGVKLADLLAANPNINKECTNIQADAEITIPTAGAAAPAPAAPAVP